MIKFDSHPIQLERVMFTKVMVEAVSNWEPSDVVLDPGQDNTITINAIPGEHRTFVFIMRAIMNPDRAVTHPYAVDIEAMAFLRADDTLTEEEVQKGIAITGHSVVYGAIRETVAWITSRQLNGPLTLGLSILRAQKSEPLAEAPKE